MDGPRKTVWVCGACWKRSRDKYGTEMIDRGWDVSCMMNAHEYYEDMLVIEDGRVVDLKPGALVSVQPHET